MGINSARLLGNVGRDPEMRAAPSGARIATFSLATSERWTQAGERQERTEWHNVVVFGRPGADGLAGVVERFVRKGSKLCLRGTIRTRKWTDKAGSDRWTTEIHLSGYGAELELLDGAGGTGKPSPVADDGFGAAGAAGTLDAAGAAAAGAGAGLDDDIPV